MKLSPTLKHTPRSDVFTPSVILIFLPTSMFFAVDSSMYNIELPDIEFIVDAPICVSGAMSTLKLSPTKIDESLNFPLIN